MPRRIKLVVSAAFAACGIWFAAWSQEPPPAPAPSAPLLTAQQLDDLVAPIALYPDPLVSEVLAASTYPLEISEAYEWVQQHPKWKPSKLMDEAKKQPWDPSVQGLVAFPQVLQRLAGDISWTTPLGNAFLAQQTDVMAAIQRMRAQAQANGKLQSNPQETVATENQNGQSAITIEPANPDVWYVPDYNPEFVWGPPVYGYYPPLLYPAVGIGFGWGPGINLGLYFGGWGGWGWGGWGWTPNWYGGGIFVDHSFFHRYGFQHFHDDGAFGRSAWVHDPVHRLGVPYGNRDVAARFGGGGFNRGGNFSRGGGFNGGGNFNRGGAFAARQAPAARAPAQRMGTPQFEQRSWTNNHSVFGGYHSGSMTRMQSDHGFSSMGAGRTFGGGGGFRGGGFRGGGGFGGGRGGGRR
jgi:hypothetical protein